MTRVIVADPLEMLQPYAQEHAAALAGGADFVLGDGTFAPLSNADVILTAWTMRFTREILHTLNRCRLIVRYGVGVDNIDLLAASACGIVVANAPTYCVSEVADHAAGLILSIARGLTWLDQQVRSGAWMAVDKDDVRVPRISQITLGIVGIGKIGRRLAQRMAPFGCRILAYDPFLDEAEIHARGAQPVASLVELLRAADVISVHVPLSRATKHLLDEAALRNIKPSAMIINTSRGGVIDEAALIRALHEDRLFGVALDVLETEPLMPDHPLLAIDPRRVILTPHFGAWCAASVPDLHAEVAGAVTDMLAGRWPAAAINRDMTPRNQLVE